MGWFAQLFKWRHYTFVLGGSLFSKKKEKNAVYAVNIWTISYCLRKIVVRISYVGYIL